MEGLIFGILQYGTKLKKLVNGKRISVRNIPTGKTGLPFQNFHLYREFPVGQTKKTFTICIPTGISGIFVVNGKQP